MKNLLSFLVILISLTLNAQINKRIYFEDDELIPREHQVDFKHLKLIVDFEPEKGKVNGTVTHGFRVIRQQVDSIFLDGPGISVETLKLDKKDAKYTSNDDGITIYFNPPLKWEEEHTLEIKYTATPKKGIYFIGWDDPTGKSRKQIWTQGQGIDNRHWIPMYDSPNDKVTSEIIATVDYKFKVLSNGRKLSMKANKNATNTWHYMIKNPHPTYLIMLGIGEYDIKTTKSKSGVEMNFYYYPDWENRVDATYKYSEQMMDFLEEETGTPYPWTSYSQIPVQDFMYGAMENTTATIFGDFYFTDARGFNDRNYVRVNAHELAHQWFGNMVSARTSSHQWLQESFATHYDLTFQGIAFGADHFNWERRKAQNQAVEASLADLKPVAHSSAGTVRHYPKGAHVLQMLKYVVGKDEFNKTIKYYLKKHGYQNVDSEDLLVAFHEVLGLSLNWFWEEWIYKGGEPSYKVEFSDVLENGERFGIFDVTQIHDVNDLVGYFQMPIVFEVHYKNGKVKSKKVIVKNQYEKVKLSLLKNTEIAYVLFDPNSEVMKSVDFKKPKNYLLSQAENADNMIDRYDAVVALQEFVGDEEVHKLYDKLLRSEKFHAIKTEIIKQISNNPQYKDQLVLALKDEDPEVKKALINFNYLITEDMLPYYESFLLDSSYEVIELSLKKLCKQFSPNTSKYLDLTKNEVGIFNKNVRIAWLEISYMSTKESGLMDELVSYTSPSYEFRTRVEAAQALSRLNYLNDKAIENMVQATLSFNSRLRNPVFKVLDDFYEQNDYRAQIFQYVFRADFNDWEKRRLRRYFIP